MKPLRTWTIGGDSPITLSVYQPAVTMRCGDGPEVVITPTQVEKLSARFNDMESYFDTGDPEML